jgi:hypothetical protein
MHYLSNFESIGDNCEFGFYLRAMGNEDGSIFRWAFIDDFDDLIRAIKRRFEGFYRIESLVPVYKDMVCDASINIQFHTDMYSSQTEGRRWVFDRRPSELQAIHRIEVQKMNYLRDKFFAGVKSGGRFYVIKKNHVLTEETARRVHEELERIGNANVLFVDEAPAGIQAGTVQRAGQRFYRGYIDRLAQYSSANDISVEGWSALCRSVWDMHHGGVAAVDSKSVTTTELSE